LRGGRGALKLGDMRFVSLNVLGGIAVLGSYALGIAGHPDSVDSLWGDMPPSLQAVYGITMWLAAAGYFPFTYLWWRHGPALRVLGGRDFRSIEALYALVLVPSALWMPLTFAWLETPSTALWIAVRLVLFLVAAGACGLLAALLTATPRPRPALFWSALAGQALFMVQTALLDPLVWPLFL